MFTNILYKKCKYSIQTLLVIDRGQGVLCVFFCVYVCFVFQVDPFLKHCFPGSL